MQTTINDSSKSRFHLLILLVIIVLAGAATLFQLWEQDIYWQIKAGGEILKTFTLQRTEQWSYTVQGTRWFNYQWLATVIISIVHQLFNIQGLIFFRALLLLSFLGLLTASLKKYSREHYLTLSILILPFLYSAIVPRIQMRPEFLVIVLNALLILVWYQDKSVFYKFVFSSIIIILATNTHPGVVPFLLLNIAAFIFKQAISQKTKLTYLAFACLCFFATPYATGLPSFLFRHANYEANTFLPNPEYFPLSLENFRPEENSLFAWSWVILTTTFYFSWIQKKERETFTLVIFTVLTALCFTAPRAIPFALLFGLPTIIDGAKIFSGRPFFQKHQVHILLFCLLWEVGQVITNPSPIGLTIYNQDLPQSTLQFIKTHKPQGNIVHAPAYGDFLLQNLPDYRVFFDSREIPYDNLQKEISVMFESPMLMKLFVQKYKVQTALLPMSFILAPPVQGMGRRESFFNSKEWAVVAYDESSMLLLKRIPEHQSLIAQYEYKSALPDKPFIQNSDETRKELERCRQENPNLSFCQQ